LRASRTTAQFRLGGKKKRKNGWKNNPNDRDRGWKKTTQGVRVVGKPATKKRKKSELLMGPKKRDEKTGKGRLKRLRQVGISNGEMN